MAIDWFSYLIPLALPDERFRNVAECSIAMQRLMPIVPKACTERKHSNVEKLGLFISRMTPKQQMLTTKEFKNTPIYSS